MESTMILVQCLFHTMQSTIQETLPPKSPTTKPQCTIITQMLQQCQGSEPKRYKTQDLKSFQLTTRVTQRMQDGHNAQSIQLNATYATVSLVFQTPNSPLK